MGAQPAAAAPAAPEPTGHEDDCEARPGCHDRLWQSLFEEAMGGDAESGKVLRAVHKKVVDQQLGSALKLLGAAKSAHRHEDGVVEELVSKQPKPTSGRTTKEEYDEGVRLGAAGDGDGGGAAGRRIEVPDDVLKQVVSGLNESSAAGCSLLGYKEIKDLYHHGYAGTLKLVMEALLNGEATGEARALLSSAKLVALRKPNGKLRPIAMGDALRKLAMTLLCKVHREEFDGFFTAPLKPGRVGGGAGGGDRGEGERAGEPALQPKASRYSPPGAPSG